MTEQNAGTPAPGPGIKPSAPAAEFMRELQTLSGANAPERPSPETPGSTGTAASAAGAPGGGTSPAPSPGPPGTDQAMAQLTDILAKINKRLDAQGQFLTKLDSKVAQSRQDLEKRFGPPKGRSEDEIGEIPNFDPGEMARQITQAVVQQVRNDIAPLVHQTTANSVGQRVMQAQEDPEVRQMVQELPSEIRANLPKLVFDITGEKMFEEQNPMFDAPDYVREAIELLHYRTVVKAGRRITPQAVAGSQANAGQQEPNPQGFSPVPSTGTHSQAPVQSAQERAAEAMFNVKLGKNRTRYPDAIERELGLT